MAGLGWQELLIIFVILLLVFGAARLPALSRALGQSVRGFRKGLADESVDNRPRDEQEVDSVAPTPVS